MVTALRGAAAFVDDDAVRRFLGLLPLVTLLLVACGRSEVGPSVGDGAELADVAVDLFDRAERIRAWGEAMVECMADAGFEMRFDGVVSFIVDDPGPQVGEFDAAMNRCEQTVGAAHPLPRRLTREEAYRVKLEVAECLRRQGYDIPQAPSLEAFLESWDRGPWDPYRYVSVPPQRWAELNRVCPQF